MGHFLFYFSVHIKRGYAVIKIMWPMLVFSLFCGEEDWSRILLGRTWVFLYQFRHYTGSLFAPKVYARNGPKYLNVEHVKGLSTFVDLGMTYCDSLCNEFAVKSKDFTSFRLYGVCISRLRFCLSCERPVPD